MSLVESLLNLHRVDTQVRALRSRLDSAERHLASQTRQLSDLGQQQQEFQTRLKHFQATAGNLEVELKSLDERLEKYRNDLNSSVTNKQYTAVLSELNTVKEERASVEDRLIQQMEEVEKLQGELTSVDEQITEKTRMRDAATETRDQRQADVGERLSELETERSQAAAVVPSDVLVIFEEMADIYDGEAMAPIEEINRRHREYACGECNMHLPFDHIVALTGACEAIVRCSSCDRILYLQEEIRGALAKK